MNLAQMTSDASGLTGTNPTAPVNTTREGDWFQPPFVDARRSSLNTMTCAFRQAPGGPGNNFFNLNWVEFGGAGVGT